MNVGIQETEHFEGVYPVIRLFDNGSNHIFLFVNQEVAHRLKDLLKDDACKFSWIIQDENESTAQFCLKIEKTISNNQISLLYLNTVSKHHIFYAALVNKLKKVQTLLTVHDVNCLFQAPFTLKPREFVQWLGKKRLRERVQGFNTVAETVKPYLTQMARQNQPVYTVPGAVYEKIKPAVPGGFPLRLVIPGTIDGKRRDYEQVFNLFDLTAELPIHFCLLGGGNDDYAQSVKARCKALSSDRISWYDESIIHQDEFDAQLDKAHFIFIPSVVQTAICGSIPEVYGITKSSGNVFDIIKHARPFIYPAGLAIPANMKNAGFSYGHLNELAAFLKKICAEPGSFQQWLNEAEKTSLEFTISRVREQQFPLFERGI